MKETNQNFLRSNLDKFLLVFLALVFVAVGYHASHHMEDINSGYSQFVQQQAAMVVGALLTLLTVGSKKGSSETRILAESAEGITEAGGSVSSIVQKTIRTDIPAVDSTVAPGEPAAATIVEETVVKPIPPADKPQ